jgi:hypothetical protein
MTAITKKTVLTMLAMASEMVASGWKEVDVEPVPDDGTHRIASVLRRGKPKTWTVSNKGGRIPAFVVEQTGLKFKRHIALAYGPGTTFTEGGPVPPRADHVETDK